MTVIHTYRIMISGGGTGGHIYPAISIAQMLEKEYPQTEIRFVGAKGRMEMQKVPQAGYAIEGLWISGIQRKLTFSNLLFPVKLISSLLKARRLIKKFKPHVVVGVGGFASGPLLFTSTGMGIPSLIQEQNSYAGLTNKWLAKRVDKICVAHEGMEKYFPKEKLVITGNPVRSDIVTSTIGPQEARRSFGLNPELSTLLVIGGSLGARTLNEAMLAGFHAIVEAGYQVIWQCGAYYYEEMKQRAMELSEHVCLLAFIDHMPAAYAAADVVVSRAGALAIAELALAGKPSILVPSPNVAEDHQTINARALVSQEAALWVKDAEAKQTLIDVVLELLGDIEKQQQLSENIKKRAKPHAAEGIADQVMDMVDD